MTTGTPDPGNDDDADDTDEASLESPAADPGGNDGSGDTDNTGDDLDAPDPA
ncbi:MAG TPA: hypothetical protein VH084_12035 [Mycobacterium sp.]|jgi:hypothetical protein|nr:hypothetical protein [Mycobacterium sp.]